jgi:hypothetical protein
VLLHARAPPCSLRDGPCPTKTPKQARPAAARPPPDAPRPPKLTLSRPSAAATAPGTCRARCAGTRRGAPVARGRRRGPGRSSTRRPDPVESIERVACKSIVVVLSIRCATAVGSRACGIIIAPRFWFQFGSHGVDLPAMQARGRCARVPRGVSGPAVICRLVAHHGHHAGPNAQLTGLGHGSLRVPRRRALDGEQSEKASSSSTRLGSTELNAVASTMVLSWPRRCAPIARCELGGGWRSPRTLLFSADRRPRLPCCPSSPVSLGTIACYYRHDSYDAGLCEAFQGLCAAEEGTVSWP